MRDLDDRVVDALKIKADMHGHSLEQELREVLIRAARLTPGERVALSGRVRAMTPREVLQTDSALVIRQQRDSCG